MENRCGSYLQMNQDVVHAECHQEGIEVLWYKKAMEKYDWLKEYNWKAVDKDKDEITKYVAAQNDPKGYVIIAHNGSNNILPIQACLYLGRETIQHVHNIIIAEEGAETPYYFGCTSGGHVGQGAAHYGVSEFYIKKNAKISFTMIHTWTENIEVFPRSASIVEENGVFLSNYCLHAAGQKSPDVPDGDLKRRELGRAVLHDHYRVPTSYIDTGSRAILEGKGSSAELITRAITKGGTIISRGQIIGKTAVTRGHLECKGLILKDGIIYAIPEIDGRVVGTESSHEAAVGKLAQEEIEYLMARGLSEDEATATIIRGFLDVKITAFPRHSRSRSMPPLTWQRKQDFKNLKGT